MDSFKSGFLGMPGSQDAQSVKRLLTAQVMIPGSWDGISHWAPCSAGSLLPPLPAVPPACAHFLSFLLTNKENLKKKKKSARSPLLKVMTL